MVGSVADRGRWEEQGKRNERQGGRNGRVVGGAGGAQGTGGVGVDGPARRREWRSPSRTRRSPLGTVRVGVASHTPPAPTAQAQTESKQQKKVKQERKRLCVKSQRDRRWASTTQGQAGDEGASSDPTERTKPGGGGREGRREVVATQTAHGRRASARAPPTTSVSEGGSVCRWPPREQRGRHRGGEGGRYIRGPPPPPTPLAEVKRPTQSELGTLSGSPLPHHENVDSSCGAANGMPILCGQRPTVGPMQR